MSFIVHPETGEHAVNLEKITDVKLWSRMLDGKIDQDTSSIRFYPNGSGDSRNFIEWKFSSFTETKDHFTRLFA